MESYNYWLSPNKLANFIFSNRSSYNITNLIVKETIDYSISIRQLNTHEVPTGLILDKWTMQKREKNNYEIITSFKIINNQSKKIAETLRSKIIEKKMEILMPFDNLHLIGNDLCFFSLIEDNSLTIRCSSFLMNEILYLFCGRSGSGKSTMIRSALENFGENITIVSDDHLTIKLCNNSIEAITPFWDDINLKGTGKKVKATKMVLFFLEDSSTEIKNIKESFSKISFIIKHCVLFAFAELVTTKIMMIVEDLVKSYEVYTCPLENSKQILDFIKQSDIHE